MATPGTTFSTMNFLVVLGDKHIKRLDKTVNRFVHLTDGFKKLFSIETIREDFHAKCKTIRIKGF